MRQAVHSLEINPGHRDLINIGVKMQEIAASQQDDELANNFAKLGNVLVTYGDAFGPKNLQDVLNRTGLSESTVRELIIKIKRE